MLLIDDTRWQKDCTSIKSAFEANRTLVSTLTSFAAPLDTFFKSIIWHNSKIEQFNRAEIKAFINQRDWDGMWNFVHKHVKNGFQFNDLIDESEYSFDSVVLAFEQYNILKHVMWD